MRVFVCKCFTIFMTGGMIYYFLEISARHYSHYSMIICGGLATLLCGGLNQMFPKMGILAQMLVSSDRIFHRLEVAHIENPECEYKTRT